MALIFISRKSLIRLCKNVSRKLGTTTANEYRKFSSNSTSKYDIIIAGGGMVGKTLACTLGKNSRLSDKKILLLEGKKKSTWTPEKHYGNRVSALNITTYKLLNKIGAWKHITAVRFGTIKKLQVWDAISDAMITFHHSDLSDTIAYVVENELIIHAIEKEINNLSNITIVNEAKIKNCDLPSETIKTSSVTLENGSNYTGTLLIGCDGYNSTIRKAMGIRYLSWNYNQKALVATVILSEESENVVAWQRFLPGGPIALLPLTNKLSTLIWSAEPEQIRKLLTIPQEQFVDEVNSALWKNLTRNSVVDQVTKCFNKFLETVRLPSNAIRQLPPSVADIDKASRAAFPIGFGHAVNYVGPGVVLAGDAAHRVHPLAGQGVNLGFGDVVVLNDVLGEAAYSGNTMGSLDSLRQYEIERQRHNFPTMLAIDGLHKLYNTAFTPVVIFRSLGLQFTHAVAPLKNVIFQQAA